MDSVSAVRLLVPSDGTIVDAFGLLNFDGSGVGRWPTDNFVSAFWAFVFLDFGSDGCETLISLKCGGGGAGTFFSLTGSRLAVGFR